MANLAALTRTRPKHSVRFSARAVLYGGFEPTIDSDTGEALDEAEVAELASRLLDARSDTERDHLLGATLAHAAHRAGGALTAPLGRTLGGMLKTVVLRDLAGPRPGQALGLELEGLEADERAFEAAQQFVRLAGEAARHAVEDPVLNPRRAARAALAAASHVYAPGLLPALATAGRHRSREERRLRNGQGRAVLHLASAAAPAVAPFDYDPEMEYFLGGIVRSVSRAASTAVRTVSRTASNVARTVDKAASAVGRIPVVGDVARAGLNAARLSLGPAAIAIDAGARVARGENVGSALRGAIKGQVDAAREQLKLAEMVAPFVPGIGTGVAAALGAANALAAGRPITDALIAAARSAVPGGAVAQAAFDVAVNLAKGKNITEAALAAARERLPGGPAARAAFDGAVALAQGKRLQDAAFAAAGRVLPPSPYAADALDFVQRVANGQNVQHAALSVAGQRALRQIQGRAALATAPLPGVTRARSALSTAASIPRGTGVGWNAIRMAQPHKLAGSLPAAARTVTRAAQTMSPTNQRVLRQIRKHNSVPHHELETEVEFYMGQASRGRKTQVAQAAKESKHTVAVADSERRANARTRTLRRRAVREIAPVFRVAMQPSLEPLGVAYNTIVSLALWAAESFIGTIEATNRGGNPPDVWNFVGPLAVETLLRGLNKRFRFIEDAKIPAIAGPISSVLVTELPPVLKVGACSALLFTARSTSSKP